MLSSSDSQIAFPGLCTIMLSSSDSQIAFPCHKTQTHSWLKETSANINPIPCDKLQILNLTNIYTPRELNLITASLFLYRLSF